ncbi:MAG: 4-hydroxybutyrate CoA-transferase, partial [Cyanobacteria bacterium RM1_2_2]|nr:4-hydroxybutyrate CoA-transferase [Cyanobacteria bacterium RM1_2_2]
IMQPEALELAIAEPAKQAGHKVDPATVRLLVEETRGQQGALPLLQFALQRMWEGLEHGVLPIDTLKRIGGVGGALAHEVEQLYDSLSEDEQKIARRIFLALVQTDESSKGTRRRATKAELIASEGDAPLVESIIRRFAAPGIRFLVTSYDEEHGETIEVAHEALIRNWAKLQEWIAECREALRQKRKIEQDAEEWEDKGKPNGYLLQGRPLRDAKEFMQAHKNHQETKLSGVATEFVRESLKKQRKEILKSFSILAIFPFIGTLLVTHIFLLNQATELFLESKDCKRDPEAGLLLRYMILVGQKT